MSTLLQIDGSRGEGGGQILRTSLALSMLTGTPFRMTRIRARREKPGLMRQHLVAVRAATQISNAEVEGAELRSQSLVFRPGTVRAGDYVFSIGSAGSTSLVLQTILYPLLFGSVPSRIVIEGGTHNPKAPPFEFLARAFLPLLSRLGPRVDVTLERAGFFPAGGGRLLAEIHPVATLGRLDLVERGEVRRSSVIAKVAHIPQDVGLREVRTFADALGWDHAHTHVEAIDSASPGNVLVATIDTEHVTEVFTGLGERGVRAEAVATRLANEVRTWLAADVAVGEHLADQLLLPLAMGAGGTFSTLPLTGHFTTQVETLALFVGSTVTVTALRPGAVRVDVAGVGHRG